MSNFVFRSKYSWRGELASWAAQHTTVWLDNFVHYELICNVFSWEKYSNLAAMPVMCPQFTTTLVNILYNRAVKSVNLNSDNKNEWICAAEISLNCSVIEKIFLLESDPPAFACSDTHTTPNSLFFRRTASNKILGTAYRPDISKVTTSISMQSCVSQLQLAIISIKVRSGHSYHVAIASPN